jgi:hypothetical protein
MASFDTAARLSADEGYFAFGGAVAYGNCRGATPSPWVADRLHDVKSAATSSSGRINLPFDLSAVVTNLREERYCQPAGNYLGQLTSSAAVQHLYYLLRPALGVEVRRHLQRVRLSDWSQILFPQWPVDFSVELLMRRTTALVLEHAGTGEMPFIWFWPDGARSCAIMTHDVEGQVGRDFCGALMDLDDSYGIKSAFQIVPEARGDTSSGLVEQLRDRGFEVNLHDLNHDGYLFHNRPQFLERAAQINRYTRQLGCRGFRSGSMYRNQRWFDAFDFSYDMSVPNVAHLEPQRGGCCTVMPYFVGDILELPLTTVQDYSLFHILGEYSIALWKTQIDLIRAMNGLISFIVHPDYLVRPRAERVYVALLEHLRRLRDDDQMWMPFPDEVDRWWRNRRVMSLVPHGRSWRIVGPDSHRARVAYARLENDRVVYSFNRS